MHTPLDLLAHLKKGIDRSEEIIDLIAHRRSPEEIQRRVNK